MASNSAKTRMQDSLQTCVRPNQAAHVKDFPRRSERLRQQESGTSTVSSPDVRRASRKRNVHDDTEVDQQRVKRARRTKEHTATSIDASLPASFDSKSKKPHRTVNPVEQDPDARRTSSASSVASTSLGQEEAGKAGGDWGAIIRLWVREGRWPREYFQASPDMDHLLARKKSSPSLSRKRSNSALSATPSDQRPREEKSAQYRDSRYELVLETKGVSLAKFELGITKESKELCNHLLEESQPVPSDTLFENDFFEATCDMLQGRNEAKVLQDVTRLIIPSAESFAIRGAKHLRIVTESVNEGWNNSIPITGTRPQPDYSVGLKRKAFSDDQLAKLAPFVGDWVSGDLSFFMATYYMYFPFLACEVKCGAAALDIADRQNAHSMAIAARAVVELFRLVKREAELDRQILSFSISHDHRSVRIYGYYPVINGKDIKYYRHPIHTFDFTTLEGKDKWTAFRFTKNVYDLWMPLHLERVRSAIDQLPSDLDFGVDPLPETGPALEELEGLDVQSATASSQVHPPIPNRQQVATPESSLHGAGAAKRPKKRTAE
ncbi:hypothetical protein VM1G_07783 [Cytospora mali]|uniref:DUF7924 domain-containing protein n=1 Tax=Cytospora mali TaxID=578113 RepID=A0A194W7S6_CYTMA|nr:hypothetical protein VM1G_07783 [Valsa mali]